MHATRVVMLILYNTINSREVRKRRKRRTKEEMERDNEAARLAGVFRNPMAFVMHSNQIYSNSY